MLPEPQSPAQKRAELARAARKAKSDPGATADLRRIEAEYAAQKLEEYIRRTVDAAPPLSAEQRLRLAGILAAGGGSHGDAA